jgi:hypothetical protein
MPKLMTNMHSVAMGMHLVIKHSKLVSALYGYKMKKITIDSKNGSNLGPISFSFELKEKRKKLVF